VGAGWPFFNESSGGIIAGDSPNHGRGIALHLIMSGCP
jgi:hypothetical protein